MDVDNIANGLSLVSTEIFSLSMRSLPVLLFLLAARKVFHQHMSAKMFIVLALPLVISLLLPFSIIPRLAIPINELVFSLELLDTNTAYGAIESKRDGEPAAARELVNKTQITTEHEVEKITQSYADILTGAKQVFAVIWFLGLSLLLVSTIRALRFFSAIKRHARPCSLGLQTQFNQTQKRLNLDNKVSLLLSVELSSPVLVGWYKPSLILPALIANEGNSDKLEHIFLHELAHVKRNDILLNFLLCAVQLIHWFNPLVWWLRRRIQSDIEVACDTRAIEALSREGRVSYGETLISLSTNDRGLSTSMISLGILEQHTELVTRLQRIKKEKTMTIQSKAIFGTLLSVIVFLLIAQPATAIKNDEKTITNYPAEEYSLEKLADFIQKSQNLQTIVGQKYADHKVRLKINKNKLDYGQLLSQLDANGYTAARTADSIQIIPLKNARSVGVRVVEKGVSYFDHEWVTKIIIMKNTCPGKLLPIIRPMAKREALVAGHGPSRSFTITDTYANIKRLTAVIETLDKETKEPLDCSTVRPPKRKKTLSKEQKS